MIDFDFGVALSALNSTHMETIRTWRNQATIMRWCRQVDVISDSEQNRWFEQQEKDPTIKMYSIWQGEVMIGVAGFTSINKHARHAEFSLYIAPKYQGSGLGLKALQTLFTHGFDAHGFHMIWGETMDGNPAIEIFDQLGMHRDGRRRDFYLKQGKLWDAQIISMTENEWKKQPWYISSPQV